MKHKRTLFCLWLGAFQLAPVSAHAQATAPLRYDLKLDAAVTGGGAVLWVGSELLKSSLAPRACNWCDRTSSGRSTLNGLDASFRNALLSSSPDTANVASSVVGFVGMPLISFGVIALAANHDDQLRQWPVDALIITEATILAGDVNQLTKFIVGRERPLVHALSPAQRSTTARSSDDNLSFFSGHTTLVFSLAAASGTVATLRNYRLAPLIWIIGMTVATFAGYLRIAADRHYFTDVFTGAVVGGGLGFAIPYLFHRPRSGPTLAPLTGNGTLGVTVLGGF